MVINITVKNVERDFSLGGKMNNKDRKEILYLIEALRSYGLTDTQIVDKIIEILKDKIS